MATEVLMPQMGESIAEGTITKWLVKVGETVERDQPLLEISTDKVDAEIPSPASGVLLEVRFQEGDTVEVNEVLAMIGAEGEKPSKLDAGTAKESTAKESAAKEAEDGEAEDGEAEDEEKAEAPAAGEESAAEDSGEDESEDGGSEAERVRKFSSPVVRKIAAEQGVDLAEVEGSGVHGRVTKKDIEAFLETRGEAKVAGRRPAAAAPAAPRKELGGFSVPAYREGEDVEIVPMSKIRQITAAHMRYSKDTSAHVTTLFHMDMSRVHKLRNRAKKGFLESHGTKLTYMPFIFKAVASALKAVPKMNAAIDGTNIVYKKAINLGIAVAMDRGLIVPVLKNADQLSLVGLAKTANDLADRARTKKLKPEEVEGGTFTITNPGVFGTLFGTPIINQPQVGILGLGTIEKRPVVETNANGDDAIVIKTMSYFAISYDHRLVDGADADEFMNHIKSTLIEESWSELSPFL